MFIGRQIQDRIKLLMQVTTLKRLEVLAHTSSTFFSLLQSKQQNENISGGDEWFCQNEGDPWYISNEESQPHMTDPWASATGTDIWEMADYPDPFSVCDSTATLLQCHPILENDASLISGTHGNSAVSTALFPDVLSSLSSDFTDSDSCSDYKVHSSSDIDEDSDWEDVTEDSGALRFQFADPVAEMLDSVVQSGVLPREHIFYKLISGALEYVSYDHSRGQKYKWDPTLVRWARSLLRLGKG